MKAYFISSLLLLCAVVLASCMESSISVDKNQFTQLLSNHLLLDHYDKALSQLSKKISRQFRDAIQVKVKRLTKKKVNTPVDVQVLKRQLKGAVGCKYLFIIYFVYFSILVFNLFYF
jgi:hypothetical protein